MSDQGKADFVKTVQHGIQRALDLLTHFDTSDANPSPENRIAQATRTLSFLGAQVYEEVKRQEAAPGADKEPCVLPPSVNITSGLGRGLSAYSTAVKELDDIRAFLAGRRGIPSQASTLGMVMAYVKSVERPEGGYVSEPRVTFDPGQTGGDRSAAIAIVDEASDLPAALWEAIEALNCNRMVVIRKPTAKPKE